MKRQLLAAVAILAMASCAKENTAIEPTIDSTAPVAASFTSASISRVADNAWEDEDKIGITMVANGYTTPITIDGSTDTYWNIPYEVGGKGETGTFSAVGTVIYFPVDGSTVDFYAYSPYNENNTTAGSVAIDVSSQVVKNIDLIAATVKGKSKSSSTVAFTGDNAFKHQLAKLNLTINQGDGVADFKVSDTDKLTTTITKQPNTATYSLFAGTIDSSGAATADISANTTVSSTSAATATAILIPTDGTATSTIQFTTTSDSNVYTWDTSNVKFEQGKEHNYEITLTRTGVVVSGSTIGDWGSGIGGNINAGDSGTTVASASAVTAFSSTATTSSSITLSWTYPSVVTSIAGVKIYYAASSTPDLATASCVDVTDNSTTSKVIESLSASTEYHFILATYNSADDETYFPTEVTATTTSN